MAMDDNSKNQLVAKYTEEKYSIRLQVQRLILVLILLMWSYELKIHDAPVECRICQSHAFCNPSIYQIKS